ncbi:AraC family transcriptional regulator [Paenibacillus sp. GCM10023252]|uniref:AraC family transcriptional regulator n=1 Tax=Paenibacillus sp. GCM10023252 TaxID=3252649 RepID=UPI00360A9A06
MHEVRVDASRLPLIRDVGTTLTNMGWIHPNRTAEFNVLIYVIEGQMQVVEDGTEYLLQEGEAFLLKSGVPHFGGEGTLPGTSTLWLHFYDAMEREVPVMDRGSAQLQQLQSTYTVFTRKEYDYQLVLPKRMKVKNGSYMIRKLRELYELYSSSQEFRHIYMSLGAMEVLLDLYRQSQEHQSRSKSDVLVSRMIAYLEEHSQEELRTEHMGDNLHLNYRYMSTLFKKKLGVSIFRYHEQLRIHQAAELLKNTSMNISEVSYTMGYASPFYFSRVFKKVMGEAPSDYTRSIYRMRGDG